MIDVEDHAAPLSDGKGNTNNVLKGVSQTVSVFLPVVWRGGGRST